MSSIRRQLAWRLFATVLILVLLAGLILFLAIREILTSEFDATQQANAQALAALVEQDLDATIELDLSPELLPRFSQSREAEYFQLRSPDGTSLRRSLSLQRDDLPPPDGWSDSPVISWDLILPDGRSGRAMALAFEVAVETEPDDEIEPGWSAPPPVRLTLTYARSREDLDRVLSWMALTVAAFGLLFPLGLAWQVKWAVGRGLSPLNRLSEQIGQVETGNLAHRFSREGAPEEIVPIVDRLNQLLTRLQKGFEREKRFSANVAHELRTPISELRALAEVALRSPSHRSNPDVENLLQDVLSVALQMERVVTTLLALSRAEHGEETVQWEAVDLAGLVRKSWHTQSSRACGRGLECDFDLPDSALVISDAALLFTILSNVIGNAVTHASRGGRLECRLQQDKRGTILTVANSNDTLQRGDLSHVFEPFWQKDPSRSSPERSGLGLATAAALASLLAIQISAELAEPNLFLLKLRLPRRSPGESGGTPDPETRRKPPRPREAGAREN